MYYIGIDIAKQSHVITILDNQGEKVGKHFSIFNTQKGFAGLIDRVTKLKADDKSRLVCGLEATGNLWEPIYDYLLKQGFTVYLINPHQVKHYKKVRGKRIKTDSLDSLAIAGLLRSSDVKGSFVPENNIRELRELVRLRANLMKNKKNYQRKALSLLQVLFPEYTNIIVSPFGIVSLSILKKYPSAQAMAKVKVGSLVVLARKVQGNNFNHKKAKELIQQAKNSISANLAVEARSLALHIVIEQIESLQKAITSLEEKIESLINPDGPDYTGMDGALSTIPGVGPKTIAAFVAEIGNGKRFEKGKDLIGYIGFYPKISQSGKSSNPHPKIVKTGPGHLRHALYLAAVACVKHNPELRRIYQNKLSQGKSTVQSLIVVARKLALVMLSMLKSGEEYNPQLIFASAVLN